MHIPDMMLQGTICPATAAVATIGLAGTAYAAYKTKIKPAASYFAGVTALIFAAQMANFPIQFDTSGHLLGATLAVALLGSAFGIMAMSLVVITQCFVFADGGVSVLGANLLNVALLASIPAVFVRECFASTSFQKTAYCIAAFVSVIIAAAACAAELAMTGIAPLQNVLPVMIYVHGWIGLAEAGLTVVLFIVLTQTIAQVAPHRAWIVPLGFAAAVALMVSPFATTSPDGLEWVAGTLGCTCSQGACVLHTFGVVGCTCAHGACMLHLSAPLAGYAVSAVTLATLSTALAGFIGVVLLFTIAYGMGRVLIRSDQ